MKCYYYYLLCFALILFSACNVNAMTLAKDVDIAEVTGMCCCVYNVGAMCSSGITAVDCDVLPLMPTVCATPGGGDSCRVITDGPSKNDSSAQGNPNDSCALSSTWCVKYIDGTCTQKYLLGTPVGCPCEGTTSTSGTRTSAIGNGC